MSQPTDNVYLSISFPNIPRAKAEEIVQNVEGLTGDHDVNFDWSDPIGENDPTPVADQAAEATGVDPTAPVMPDVVPTDAPVLTVTDTPVVDQSPER